MILIGRRKAMLDEAFTNSIERVPQVWAHARAMQMFQKMGVLDQDSFKLMAATMGPQWKTFKWVSSIPLSVATVLQADPETRDIFSDTSGRLLFKFLERNPQYKVPKGAERVQVSVPRAH